MKDRRLFLSYFSFGKAIIVTYLHTHSRYCAHILSCSLPTDEFPIQSTRFVQKYFPRMRVCYILFFSSRFIIVSQSGGRGPLIRGVQCTLQYYIIIIPEAVDHVIWPCRAHSSRRKRKKIKKNTRDRDIDNNIIYIIWIYNCDTRLSVTESFITRSRCHRRVREMKKSSQRFLTPI